VIKVQIQIKMNFDIKIPCHQINTWRDRKLSTIIDGKAFSANLRGEIARKVSILKQQHSVTPGLAVVLVGEDPASQVWR